MLPSCLPIGLSNNFSSSISRTFSLQKYASKSFDCSVSFSFFFLSNLTQKFQVIPEEYLKQLLTQYKRCRYNHPNVIKNIRAFWACPRNVPHKCFTNISKVSVFPSSSELPLLYVNVTFLWSYFQMSLSIYHAKNPLVLEIKFIIVYFQGMCKETSGMRLVNWLNYEN